MGRQNTGKQLRQMALSGLGAVLLAFTLSACSSAPSEEGSKPSEEGSNQVDGNASGGNAVTEQEELIGRWSSDERGTPHLEFTEDGEVRGSDGCNGIATNYTVEGDRIVLEQFASTLRACQGVDGWLRGVSELRLDGDTLHVMDRAGDEIGQLQRDAA